MRKDKKERRVIMTKSDKEEFLRLKEREAKCPTINVAQTIALIRCFQECCDAVGIDRNMASPSDLVEEIKRRFDEIECPTCHTLI